MPHTAQPGIFAEGSAHHYYLEYRLNDTTDLTALRSALAQVLGLAAEPGAAGHLVLGFGPALWHRLSPGLSPEPFAGFSVVSGVSGQRAEASQADLWIWLHGEAHDRNFARALHIQGLLAGQLDLALDLHGFVYGDSRDLTGFEDGTANPKGDDRFAAALVADGEPGAGGSLVLTQRWVHDLGRFLALPQIEQEAVIGRTKPDSIELEGAAMPADSHVSRTDVKQDGVALKIYRRSTPFGNVSEHGLYFLAFACSQTRFQIMLERMFGATEDGIYDRLVGYSRALTGSYWFAPSVEDLRQVLAA